MSRETDYLNSIERAARTTVEVPHPVWNTWVATLNGSGGVIGAYAEADAVARYTTVGHICFFRVRKRITNVGGWTGNIQLALPIAAANYGVLFEFPPCWWADGAAPNAPKAFAYFTNGTTLLFTDLLRSSNFTWAEVVANDTLVLNTFYEI